MPRPHPAKRAAYHHGNLREVLVETSLKVIEKHGIGALTLREIGAQAGVSRTAAYRHFASKEDLLCAISEAGFALFRSEMAATMAAVPADFPSRLRAMAVAYVRFALRHQARFAVMFDVTRRPPIPPPQVAPQVAPQVECVTQPEGDLAFAQLEGVVREGQEKGYVRAGETTLLAHVVWAHIHGVSLLRLAVGPSGDMDEDLLSRMTDLLLKGVARPKEPGPAPRKRRKP